ncbi:hypothetical protein VLK31_21030 [Variovorax sp. H27-G14]|uniref:hypothetical protein n=1 Tax=Variovorax sp. H27-G14 TaxID=3111914 RepID=UPI0038FC8D67
MALAAAGLLLLGGCPQKEAATGAADVPAAPTAAASAATAPGATPAPSTPPTASASLKRADLMALVFPDSQGPNAKPEQPDAVSLPEIGNDGKSVPGSTAEQNARVSPREVVKLDDTHAVMLTETVPVDDQGQAMDGHANGAWLGAYFFEQGPEGWKLTSRTDGVDYLGFMGNLGTTKIERMAPRRYALTITNGSCWQGYCGEWLAVYALDAGKVRPVTPSIAMSASNEGASEGCDKPSRPESLQEPQQAECYDISGTPAFTPAFTPGPDDNTPGEMRIAFKGTRTVVNGKSRHTENIDNTLVYAWRKDAYVLTEGRNPVPSF